MTEKELEELDERIMAREMRELHIPSVDLREAEK